MNAEIEMQNKIQQILSAKGDEKFGNWINARKKGKAKRLVDGVVFHRTKKLGLFTSTSPQLLTNYRPTPEDQINNEIDRELPFSKFRRRLYKSRKKLKLENFPSFFQSLWNWYRDLSYRRSAIFVERKTRNNFFLSRTRQIYIDFCLLFEWNIHIETFAPI